MPSRPISGRALDEHIALQAVRMQPSSSGYNRATHLGAGWATDVYLIDDQVTARFPRNEEIAAYLDTDESVFRFVESELGNALTVPRLRQRGRATPYFPYGFLVCEFIPGVGADHASVNLADSFAGDLGHALTLVHSVSVARARALGLTQPSWDDYTGSPRFLHGDFSPDNLIVDPEAGRLAGVIDWGNAALGDPVLDFAPLLCWRGWEFVEAVLEEYKVPTDEGFARRLRRRAQLQALQWLTDTVKRGSDPELHLSWVRNAFARAGAF